MPVKKSSLKRLFYLKEARDNAFNRGDRYSAMMFSIALKHIGYDFTKDKKGASNE
jgi:hypothetical protein